MGQAQPNNTKENLDPAILKIISEALSSGVAKSIIDTAVENIAKNAVTASTDENPNRMGSQISCGRQGAPSLTNAEKGGRRDDAGEGCRVYQGQYR
jgi:hypothetical protein